MASSTLALRLRKILPFIGRNNSLTDRELNIRAFRRLYAEDPNVFLDAYDAEIERLKQVYPQELVDLIDQAGLTELDDQLVASEREDGSVTSVYACGFLAYGLANEALASEYLEEADAERLRALLTDEYFVAENVQIQIYQHIVPINHKILSDSNESQRFLRTMMKSRAALVPEQTAIDMSGIDYNYDEEDMSDVASHFRLILLTVRALDPKKPVLKTSYRYLGFTVPADEGHHMLAADAILMTRWGAEFSALISRRCGRGLRYCVTEPYLLNDTVRQLDYVIGLKRIMVVFTRTALDENVAPEDLVVSLGAFSDPQKGYSELRVAFAHPDRPDDLINGVPLPLPAGQNAARAVEELIAMIADQFTFEGITLKTPIPNGCSWLTAEPDTMDRLYNSVNNVQKPLKRRDNAPHPLMPSMLLN